MKIDSYGASYPDAIHLQALKQAHKVRYSERQSMTVDGNTAAAIPFVQWWRAPIMAGFPITPATKWLEHLATEVGGGKLGAKRVKLLESEHAAADYMVGVAAACRSLIVGTATSSVGLDHMTETVRSLGASGLGNVVLVNVCRATANYPLCIEGDPSDTLGHRDDGFIQVMCRGKQQIYDTLLQMPAIGMHSAVMTPTMPAYYGIKDSHRAGVLQVEPDNEVNEFLETAFRLDSKLNPPGLLDGDTSMGNCVTSAWFQGFKIGQKQRMEKVHEIMPKVSTLFEKSFGRPGLQNFELHRMEDHPEVVIVTMGPDSGTAIHLLEELRREFKVRVGVVVLRLLSPFPSVALAKVLSCARSVLVINNAHHHGRGHLTLDVADALMATGKAPPIEAFFCGMGGADVSVESFKLMTRMGVETAARGTVLRRWHVVHDGTVVAEGN